MVVDISKFNGYHSYPERYPNAQIVNGFPTPNEIDQFIEGLDCIFFAESPYNNYLIEAAQAKGIKIVNQYNYEFLDYLEHPEYPVPDMLIAPSKWNYDVIEDFARQNNVRHAYVHCPVNRDDLPYRVIKRARTFLHMAGKPAAHDRNGTLSVIEASKYIKSDIKIIIHFQGEQGLRHQLTHTTQDYKDYAIKNGNPAKLDIKVFEYSNYQDVYSLGDVLVLPRRYGGNCLPMNEAVSCGMPVIMSDISPNNQFLPSNWLVTAMKIDKFTPRMPVDIYGVSAIELAAKIDEFANMNESQMYFENLTADKLAQGIDWRKMQHEYRILLEGLCNQ